jgi:hypothetical protein
MMMKVNKPTTQEKRPREKKELIKRTKNTYDIQIKEHGIFLYDILTPEWILIVNLVDFL